MMNKLFSVLLTVLLLLGIALPASAAETELVVNGDASDGLWGWTDPDGIWLAVQSYGIVTPYDSFFFTPADDLVPREGESHIYQDVSVAEYAGVKAVYSAYVRTWDANNTDETKLVVEFFDADGQLLDSGEVTSSNDPEWHRISLTKTIPQGAVTARLSLHAIYWYGSGCDSYFDNVSFLVTAPEATPAPRREKTTDVGDSAPEVQYEEINIVLNGQKITPTDGAGNALKPAILNGIIYIPIGTLPSALGMDISWDEATNTIYIGDQPSASVGASAQNGAPEPEPNVQNPGEPPAPDIASDSEPYVRVPVEPPTLEDFQWLNYEIYSGGAPEDAPRLAFPEIIGGWKVYLITDPQQKYDSFMESLMTAYIEPAQEGVSVTLDWYYSRIGETDEDFLDDSPDSEFMGSWADGSIEAYGPGSIHLTDFFRWEGKDCAIGWMVWPDGVDAFIAMVKD